MKKIILYVFMQVATTMQWCADGVDTAAVTDSGEQARRNSDISTAVDKQYVNRMNGMDKNIAELLNRVTEVIQNPDEFRDTLQSLVIYLKRNNMSNLDIQRNLQFFVATAVGEFCEQQGIIEKGTVGVALRRLTTSNARSDIENAFLVIQKVARLDELDNFAQDIFKIQEYYLKELGKLEPKPIDQRMVSPLTSKTVSVPMDFTRDESGIDGGTAAVGESRTMSGAGDQEDSSSVPSSVQQSSNAPTRITIQPHTFWKTILNFLGFGDVNQAKANVVMFLGGTDFISLLAPNAHEDTFNNVKNAFNNLSQKELLEVFNWMLEENAKTVTQENKQKFVDKFNTFLSKNDQLQLDASGNRVQLQK